jgi:hypothetical protein
MKIKLLNFSKFTAGNPTNVEVNFSFMSTLVLVD